MELIQAVRIRMNEKERESFNKTCNIIDELHVRTIDYDLTNLTGRLVKDLEELKEYIE